MLFPYRFSVVAILDERFLLIGSLGVCPFTHRENPKKAEGCGDVPAYKRQPLCTGWVGRQKVR